MNTRELFAAALLIATLAVAALAGDITEPSRPVELTGRVLALEGGYAIDTASITMPLVPDPEMAAVLKWAARHKLAVKVSGVVVVVKGRAMLVVDTEGVRP